MTIMIFLGCCGIVLITMFVTLRQAARPNGNLLLGVTLPTGCMGESGVQEILRKYRRAYLLLTGTEILLVLPLFLLGRVISFQLLYLTGWTTLVIGGGMHLLTRYFKKLYALKTERGWLVGEKHVIRVDTAVTRESGVPSSTLWLLPGLFFAAGSAAFALLSGRLAGVSAALPPLICVALFFLRGRNEVYSGDSEENLRRAREIKRARARCWAQLAAISGVTGLGILLLLYSYLPEGIFLLCAVDSALALWALLAAHRIIRRARAGRSEELLVDDDQYWERGYYYNPEDPAVFVEKRVGYGWTVNVAHPAGRILNFLVVLVFAGVVALSGFLMQFDFGEITLRTEGSSYLIEAPVYHTSFEREDIRSVTELEEMPHATKQSGLNADFLWLGTFQVEDYGRCEVFVYPQNGPVLAIELTDNTIFLNGETPEQTAAFAALLPQ